MKSWKEAVFMIAIIPARGGSKGLPGKNIKPLLGKPLIGYTIEAALKSEFISDVIVSTDSEEIAAAARSFGATTPFLRPDELSIDTANAVDVYLHTMDYMRKNYDYQQDKFLVLLPTAPLRTVAHINQAVRQFFDCKADTLISVKKAENPPGWYFVKNQAGMINNAGFTANTSMQNRQENNEYYIPNGAIYILDYELLKKKRTYYSDKTIPYIMDKKESVDIDTTDDFEYAEFLLKKSLLIKKNNGGND